MRIKRAQAAAVLLWLCVVLSTGGLMGQEQESGESPGQQISAEQFRAELARAQSDIELLRRALRRKQDAEKLAMECRQSLRAAEEKLDQLRKESSEELAKRAQTIAALEARVQETKRQLEAKGETSTSKDVEKLKGELDAKIRELTEAQKSAGRLASMLEAAVKETEKLRKEREKSSTELAEARKALEDLTKKSGDDKKKLEEEKKKLSDEKSALDKKLAEANKKVGDLTKSRDKHKKDLDQAGEDLNAAFALMKRDRKLKEEAIAKNVAKAKELSASQEREKKSQEAIVKLKSEKQAALTEIEELRKKLAGRNDDGASKKRIEALEKRIAEAEALTKEHAELEKEKERALRQLIDAGVMIQQLAAQRDEARTQLESAVTSQKEAESKAEESLGAALEKALAEKKAAEEQRDTLRQQVESDRDVSKEIKEACERAEKNLEKLKEELSSGNRVADALGDKLRRAAESLAKLRLEKRNADEQIAALADQLESERQSHQSEMAKKDSELAALEGQLAKAQTSANSRQNAYVDAGAYINQLLLQQKGEVRNRLAAERALKEAGDVIGDLLADQEQFKKQLADAKRHLSRQKADGESTGRSLANAEGRITQLQAGIDQVKVRLQETLDALAVAKGNATQLAAEKLTVEATLQDTARMLRDVVNRQNGQQKQLADLEAALASEKSGHRAETNRLVEARGEIAKLSTALEQQRKVSADAARNAVAVAAALSALKTEKGNADRKLAELAASLDAANKAKNDLSAKFDSSEKTLAARTAELEELRSAFRELESRHGIAEEALEESNQVIRDLLAAKEACDARIAELTTAGEKQLAALTAVRAELKSETEARKVALSVKAETEQQLAGLTKELDTRKLALDAANQATQRLAAQLKALTGDRNTIAAERAALQQALSAEQARVRDLTWHASKLRDQLEKKGSELNRLNTLLASEQRSGVAAKSTLLGSASFLKELLTRHASERDASEKAHQQLLADMEKLRRDFGGKLEASEQARVRAVAEGKESIQSLAAAAQIVKDQKLALDKRVTKLQAELADAKKQGEQASDERAALARRFASARERIAELEDKEAEIERIRTYAGEVENNKLQAEIALKEAATFIGELLDLRKEDTNARRAAERALLKLKGDFEGVEKQAEELRRKLNDLEQLKIKKAEAEDRLAKLEKERKRSNVATDSALAIVQELRGARVEAVTAQQNAENAFHAAVLELDRLRFEVARKEQEYQKLLTEKELTYEKQLGEKQQMLVLANTRLGDVDNRLRTAIREREMAETTATEAAEVLQQLRSEKSALDGRIDQLKRLVEQEKTGREGHASELKQLREKLAAVVVERDRVSLARQAAEKNAVAMGEILAKQSAEIESSRELAAEFVTMKAALDKANIEKEKLAAELENVSTFSTEAIALKESLATKELDCRDRLEQVLGKVAEREKKIAELEAVAKQAKVLQAELEKLKGADNRALEEALARAVEFESKAKAEQQKAAQYQFALKDSEAAVEMLAAKVREVDSVYGGALKRIEELEGALGQARDDRAKALKAALDVKEKLLRIDPIWYALNSASIEEEQARILKQARAIRAQYPDAKFEISGHTCTIGSRDANQRLSESRARGLAEFLTANGIPRATISFKGYGPARPIGDNATEEGRRRNRRVEIEAIIPE